MPVYGWVLFGVAATVAISFVGWIMATRNRSEPTTADRLQQAANAAKALRRASPRANRDTFEQGRPPGDRYSAAIMENAAYSDGVDATSGSGD